MRFWQAAAMALALVAGFVCATSAWAADDAAATRDAQWARLSAAAPDVRVARDLRVEYLRCRLDPTPARHVRVQEELALPDAPAERESTPRYLEGSCWPPGCRNCEPQRPCEWRIGLMGWLAGVDGTLTLDGQQTDIDFPFSDWFDNLDSFDWATNLFATYRWKCWTFGGSWVRTRLGDSVPITDVADTSVLNASVSLNFLKFWIGYDVFRRSFSQNSCWPCVTWQLYAGMRYYSMAIEARPTAPGSVFRPAKQTQEWVDPLFGTAVRVDFSRKWAAVLEADAGGFDAGSDLSWHLMLGLEWSACRWLALQAGWNIIGIDYDEGGGQDEFGFNATLNGPYLSLIFVF